VPKVLIADDEPFQRILIRETLTVDPQFVFVEAENGAQALDKARREQPDLIILDIMMPEMDGLQVSRALKADPNLQAIPVIMVTALNKEEDRVNALDAGAANFLSKPFEADELQDVVYQALNRDSAASGS
jgi:CheY-like chemotaxis protein